VLDPPLCEKKKKKKKMPLGWGVDGERHHAERGREN
jgi:hypothetical protein